jgi:D-3-phosphoglycerate dehydrogenase
MKDNAVLINTSRGPVIDEAALVDHCRQNPGFRAGLDVFEEEPLPLSSPLLKMKNVMMAPHNSNSSPFAWEFIHTNTINNLMDSLGLKARI